MISKLDDICTCCGGYENQPLLQLFEDGCFRIVDGKETKGGFCINDFAFPVDGYNCVNLNIELDGGEITLFDNKLDEISPLPETLESGKAYARGVMIRVAYPINDQNGEELKYTDKSVKIYLENSETFVGSEFPIHDFFTIFTNAKSNRPQDLINKIKIINPNESYNVRINAIILMGNAE
jgi:hypothetical protein